MKVKLFLLSFFALALYFNSSAQLIQGTIKPGASSTEIEVWLKPNFSNSTQYLAQIGLPIAFPSSASPQPTGLTVVLDPAFITSFGSNYTVSVNPVANNTGNTEKFFNILLIRGGAGASNPQTWTSGTEFKVLKATFTYAAGSATFFAKLADYQDGGSDGQGFFYSADGNANYYMTDNSVGNFYAAPGLSVVGGNASAGYAQLIGTCTTPSAPVITNITASNANINWGAVGGAIGYEYAVTTSATPPASGTATVSTTFSPTGLTGGTQYYAHVRANCGAGLFSSWATTPFSTCSVPVVPAITGTTTVCTGATTQLNNTTPAGVWSSDAPGTASINSSGLVTGVAAGTTTIHYAVTNGCGTTTTDATITVNTVPTVAPITGTTSFCAGSTSQLSSTTPGGVWSSDNAGIASVNSTGLVTGVTGGSTTIHYAVTNSCGTTTVNASVTINDVPAVPAITGSSTVCTGSTTQLLNASTGGVWSSNSANATVDANGLVTGVSVGSATISYAVTNACGTTTVTKVITVTSTTTVGSITGTTTVCTGATTQLANSTGGGTWSSNSANATVDANGLVTGVSAGSATITYTVSNSCGTASANAVITINTVPSVAAITGSSSVCTSSTIQLASITPGGTWSSNSANATVSTSGLVTGVSSGSATISYAVTNSCGTTTVTKLITVNTVPSVPAITGTTSLIAGATSQLANTTAGGIWSSNNNPVATVNATGLVTAVSAGSATISYAVTNTCGTTTVTATITVGAALIQGTIKNGTTSNQVEIWLKPNFSNSSQYLAQIGMPIAFPASASPIPTALTVTLDPGFVAAFGNNYTVTVNPVAQNTGATEKYYNIVLIREGAGASSPQSWSAASEFKVLTATFAPSNSPGTVVKLADYQDGGSDGQGYFYSADGNANYYYTTISNNNFYATAGQSTIGGTATTGYAQTIAFIGGCATMTLNTTKADVLCHGGNNGSINATAAGVTGPFTYNLKQGVTTLQTNGTGIFTNLVAGAYIVEATNGSCTTNTPVTITEPAGVIPDITMGADFTDNLFPSNASEVTVVYNIIEVGGNPAPLDTIRIPKIAGYNVLFDQAATTITVSGTAYTLDNTKWTITFNATDNRYELVRNNTAGGGNNTISCQERINLSVRVQRNTTNKSTFNYISIFKKIANEVYLNNNQVSVRMIGE